MEIEELPQLKKTRYTERITLAISEETKRQLNELKASQNIDTTELIRRLINNFLSSLAS